MPSAGVQARAGAPRLVALRALLAATTGAAEVYVPYYLQHERGVSLTASGLVIAATAIGWGLGASAQAGWARRVGTGRMLLACALAAPLAPASILVTVLTHASPWVIAAGLFIMGFGMGAAYPQISTLALELTPARQHASIGGALQLSEAASAASMLAVTGVILAFGGTTGLVSVYVLLVAVGALGVVVARSATRDAPA